jgi:post-segregation antitoxin (ccd killing protein)
MERQLTTVSLRQAAAEIGLSPNALKNFLAGAEPRATTRAKLERWLAGRKTSEPAPKVTDLVRLIGDLAVDLSAAQSAALGRETARLLAQAYQERNLTPPRWVRELATHYGSSRSR